MASVGQVINRSYSSFAENSSKLVAGLKLLSSLAAARTNSWSGANSGNESSLDHPDSDNSG